VPAAGLDEMQTTNRFTLLVGQRRGLDPLGGVTFNSEDPAVAPGRVILLVNQINLQPH